MDATYNNTSSFKVTGDETTWLTPGTMVKLTQTGVTQSGIQSVVYSGGETIVTLHDAVVAADLSAVTTVGAVGLENGLSTHQHNRNPGSGGLIGINRMIMTYVSTSAMTIGSGNYYIENAAGKAFNFWSDADISYTFTSLGATQLQYLYADFSVIEGMDWWEVDATCFYNSTTTPTWSDARRGWYNGDDLCIWNIPTNTSSQIPEFKQHHRKVEYFLASWDIASAVTLNLTPTNYATGAPLTSSRAYVLLYQFGCGFIVDAIEGSSQTRQFFGNNEVAKKSMTTKWMSVDASGNIRLAYVTATGAVFYSTLMGHEMGQGM